MVLALMLTYAGFCTTLHNRLSLHCPIRQVKLVEEFYAAFSDDAKIYPSFTEIQALNTPLLSLCPIQYCMQPEILFNIIWNSANHSVGLYNANLLNEFPSSAMLYLGYKLRMQKSSRFQQDSSCKTAMYNTACLVCWRACTKYLKKIHVLMATTKHNSPFKFHDSELTVRYSTSPNCAHFHHSKKSASWPPFWSSASQVKHYISLLDWQSCVRARVSFMDTIRQWGHYPGSWIMMMGTVRVSCRG